MFLSSESATLVMERVSCDRPGCKKKGAVEQRGRQCRPTLDDRLACDSFSRGRFGPDRDYLESDSGSDSDSDSRRRELLAGNGRCWPLSEEEDDKDRRRGRKTNVVDVDVMW